MSEIIIDYDYNGNKEGSDENKESTEPNKIASDFNKGSAYENVTQSVDSEENLARERTVDGCGVLFGSENKGSDEEKNSVKVNEIKVGDDDNICVKNYTREEEMNDEDINLYNDGGNNNTNISDGNCNIAVDNVDNDNTENKNQLETKLVNNDIDVKNNTEPKDTKEEEKANVNYSQPNSHLPPENYTPNIHSKGSQLNSAPETQTKSNTEVNTASNSHRLDLPLILNKIPPNSSVTNITGEEHLNRNLPLISNTNSISTEIIRTENNSHLLSELMPIVESDEKDEGKKENKSAESLKNKSKKKKKFVYKSYEQIMEERRKHLTESSLNPLSRLLKKVEDSIKKQNDYDYKRIMKDIEIKVNKSQKFQERSKKIEESKEKMREKLKNMEEYREILYQNKARKILAKQRKYGKILSEKNGKKRKETFKTKSGKCVETEGLLLSKDSGSGSLSNLQLKPGSISTKKRCEFIRKMKEKIERDFIVGVENKLQEEELDHLFNFEQMKSMNKEKYVRRKQMLEKKIEECKDKIGKALKDKEDNYLKKKLHQIYSFNKVIERNSSLKEKSLKSRQAIYDSVQEKKQLISEENLSTIKKYNKLLGERNRRVVENIERNKGGKRSEKSERRQLYLEAQKLNYKKLNEERKEKKMQFLFKQEDVFDWADYLSQQDNYIKEISIKNTIRNQNELSKKINDLNKFIGENKGNNILLSSEKERLKIYRRKVRLEMEEELKNKKK